MLKWFLKSCSHDRLCMIVNFLKVVRYPYEAYISKCTSTYITFIFLVSLRELLALEGKSNLSSCFFHLILSPIGSSQVIHPLHKKWSFPLRISSINVSKSAVSCEFCHIYWNPSWKLHFLCSDPKFIYAGINIKIQVSKYSGLVLHTLY